MDNIAPLDSKSESLSVDPTRSHLPVEILEEIFSYLVNDIDNFSSGWSRTCVLARRMVEKELQKYCEKHDINYAKLKKEYLDLLAVHKSEVLPLADFIRCHVSREVIHRTSKYSLLSASLKYSDIPYSICQFGYLSPHTESAESVLRMAIIVGNTRACEILLKDESLRQYAYDTLKHLLQYEKTSASILRKRLIEYEASLPWEVIDDAFIRGLIACYEVLSSYKTQYVLPSKEKVAQSFLTQGEFVCVDRIMKHWGAHLMLPYAFDLFFQNPSSTKRKSNLNSLCNRLHPLLTDHTDQIVQKLHEHFLGKSTLSLTWYESNWMLFQLKQQPAFTEITELVFSKTPNRPFNLEESQIKLAHIFSIDERYLSYLLDNNMQVRDSTLLRAISTLHSCSSYLKHHVVKRIQRLLYRRAEQTIDKLFLESLLKVVAHVNNTVITQTVVDIIPKDRITIALILSLVPLDQVSVLLNAWFSCEELQTMQEKAIEESNLSAIRGLFEVTSLDWHVNWNHLIQDFLIRDNYKHHQIVLFTQFLIEKKRIKPTSDLLKAVWNYLEGLLHFVYQEEKYTSASFKTAVQVQWHILELYLAQTAIQDHQAKAMAQDILDKSMGLVHNHADLALSSVDSVKIMSTPFRLKDLSIEHMLSSKTLCTNLIHCAFRLKGLELIDSFFLQGEHPLLLSSLTTEARQSHILKTLSLFRQPWFWIGLQSHSEDTANHYLSIVFQLITRYRIQENQIVQAYTREAIRLGRVDLLNLKGVNEKQVIIDNNRLTFR